jgi:hypothetical protein
MCQQTLIPNDSNPSIGGKKKTIRRHILILAYKNRGKKKNKKREKKNKKRKERKPERK